MLRSHAPSVTVGRDCMPLELKTVVALTRVHNLDPQGSGLINPKHYGRVWGRPRTLLYTLGPNHFSSCSLCNPLLSRPEGLTPEPQTSDAEP